MKTFLLNGVNIRVREFDGAVSLKDLISAAGYEDQLDNQDVQDAVRAYMSTIDCPDSGNPEVPGYLLAVTLGPRQRCLIVKPEYLSDVITGMEPPVEWKAEFWEAYAEFLRSNYVGPRPVTVASESDTNKSDNPTAFDPDLEEAIVLINAEQIRRDDQRALLTKKLAKVLTPTRHIPKEVRSRSGSLQDGKYQLRKMYVDREAIEYRLKNIPMMREASELLKAKKDALDAQIQELSDAISNSKENEGTNV